jgi:hypothetical protein
MLMTVNEVDTWVNNRRSADMALSLMEGNEAIARRWQRSGEDDCRHGGFLSV